MGGGRNCTLIRVAREPISQWTCKCGRGYWDSGKQKEVLGGPIGRGEAATRAEYEAHKRGCATCRDQAEEDDWNSLRRGHQRPLEPVCSVERRHTDRQAGHEPWEASLESQDYGEVVAEQSAQVETRRHVSRDSIPPSTRSQRGSGLTGTDFSRHGEAPFFTLFPHEDTVQRTINTPYQPSAERSQDVRVPPRHTDTFRRDSKDDQRRGSFTGVRRDSNVDSLDRTIIRDIGGHREPSIKAQMLPVHSSRLSTLARRFVELGLGHYSEYARFISDNPKILAQSEIDALVAEALTAEKAGHSTVAQTCTHQALLLRECKNLGLREVVDFIRKLEARDGKANDTFVRDVKKVYISIQEQARKSLLQNQTVAPESHSRKTPIISQATDDTNPQDPPEYSQSLPGHTQAQTQVTRNRDGQLVYTDDQGRVLRPATSRHDPDLRRSIVNPAQTTMQHYRGAPSESYGRNQPTISQTAERTAYTSSTTGREVPDFQWESRYPSEDISGGMVGLQINTDDRSDDQFTRAEVEKEVVERLRRSGRLTVSKQELERQIDEQFKWLIGQKR